MVSAPTAQNSTLLSGLNLEDSEAHLEDSIQAILGHGNFQRTMLFCGSLAAVVLLCHSLLLRLIARDVDHWCKPPSHLDFLTVTEWKNVAIPVLDDGTFSRCTIFDPPLDDSNKVGFSSVEEGRKRDSNETPLICSGEMGRVSAANQKRSFGICSKIKKKKSLKI